MSDVSADLARKRERGIEARALVENPTLNAAFAAVEAAILSQWRMSAPSDAAQRERLWQMLAVLLQARAMLDEFILTGRIASEQLNQKTSGE